MAGTAEGALIARRGDHDDASPDSVIECLFQGVFSFGGGLRKGNAQVDDSCARVDTFHDRHGKLLGCRTRHLFTSEDFPRKRGGLEGCSRGKWRVRGEFRFADKMPATKVPCRQAALLRCMHVAALSSWNLVQVFARQIEMLRNNRPIDEPDLHFRSPAGTFHQRCELD